MMNGMMIACVVLTNQANAAMRMTIPIAYQLEDPTRRSHDGIRQRSWPSSGERSGPGSGAVEKARDCSVAGGCFVSEGSFRGAPIGRVGAR